jgi:hypothetical protein
MNGDRSERCGACRARRRFSGTDHPMLIPSPSPSSPECWPPTWRPGGRRPILVARFALVAGGRDRRRRAGRGAVGAIDYFTIRRAREKPVGKIHAYANAAALTLSG